MTPSLRSFVGNWTVHRVIHHTDGGRAQFRGTAQWAPDADGLAEVETGTLTQAGQSFETSRRTLWRDGGDAIEVQFADGRPFHRIIPAARVRAYHDCPPDAYWLSYDFSCWPHWSVRWSVEGPRKGYRALTRYRPSGAVAPDAIG